MEITFVNTLLLVVVILAIFALVLAFLGTKIKKRWDATSMYNIAVCLVVASIISGTISFLAIWVALPNSKEVDFTHQDVVVDILGMLVTILIGWNILSVVDIKKKAESIEYITTDLERVISGIIQMTIHSFVMRGDKEAVINSCFLSLEKVLDCRNEFVRATATREILKVLHQVNKSYEVGETVFVYKGKKESYNSILWNLDDEYKAEIAGMIKDARELNTNGDNIAFAGSGTQTTYTTKS